MDEGVRAVEAALKRYDALRGQSEYNVLKDAVRAHLRSLLIRVESERGDGADQVARHILGRGRPETTLPGARE